MPLVPILGIVTCAAMIFGLGWTNWARLGGWLVVGFLIYFGYSRRNSKKLGTAPGSTPAT